jgi:hypothetical protein
MDAITVFGSDKAAASYLGVALNTLQNQLYTAYRNFEAHGLVFEGSGHARRTQAVRAWLLYWWSEEGKAELRNKQLTRNPLA